jgi:hypothetical protein
VKPAGGAATPDQRPGRPARHAPAHGLAPGDHERGSAVIEFAVIFVTLVVPLVYVIVTMAGVQRAMLATSSAAREAGRLMAVADNEEVGRDRAERAVDDILANHQLTDRQRRVVRITASCPDHGQGCGEGTGFGPGATVEVTITYRVPIAGFLSPVLGLDLPVGATNRTRVDRYRGLGG